MKTNIKSNNIKYNIKKIIFILIILFFVSCDNTVKSGLCSNVTCSNHGFCALEKDGSPTCICDEGYSENNLNCEVDCNLDCNQFQNCNIVDEKPICECKTGYTLKDDNCIYDCSDIPNSIINSNNNGCKCIDNYILDGATCIKKPNSCEGIECSGNGKCKIDNNIVTCDCDDGYYLDGLNCTDIDECKNNPCNSNATCSNSDGGFNCNCNDGYEGDGINCSEKTPLCKNIDCGNGSCEVKDDKAVCKCNSGYHADGLKCVKDRDQCGDISCGHGECKLNNGEAICDCDQGYHADGLRCEKDSNPCENIDCGNGKCEVKDNKAVCKCDEGYHTDGLSCIEIGGITNLRLMAANITSGPYQSYREHGMRIFQALKPDVVMIQEFKVEVGSLREFVDEAFGRDFQYFQGENIYNIPNGVVSKYPIMERGIWYDPDNQNNKDFVWATIDIPGDKDLFVISVHLRTKSGTIQKSGAQVIAKKIFNYRIIHPNEYYYAVGGDLNGGVAVSADGFGSYNGHDVFVVSEENPTGEDGFSGTNKNRNKHYDWILETPDLQTLQVPTKYCAKNSETDCKIYQHGLVFDSTDFNQSELNKYFSPVLEADSRSQNMQHMGIIKDFEIIH